MSDRHRLTIFHDDRSFSDRRERLLDDMRRQVDEDLKRFGFGRHHWSSDVLGGPSTSGSVFGTQSDWKGLDPISRLSDDFFRLRPSSPATPGTLTSRRDDFGSGDSLDDGGTVTGVLTDFSQPGAAGKTGRQFCMSFDVKDYDAEDISVTVEDQTMIVRATHRTEKDGAVSVKEFSRKIRIPPEVDPEKLTSTLSSDGILTVEAPVPPAYQAVEQAASSSPASSLQQFGQASPQQQEQQNGAASPRVSAVAAAATPAVLDTPTFSWDEAAGRRKLSLLLEVGVPYTADDVVVKLDGRRLIVEATHAEKFQGRTSKTSMSRDFDLPEDIDISTIRALLQSNGQLSVTAYVK
jgi:HSP20 family molecular chaperone IbpA